jgi:hypothetical protein
VALSAAAIRSNPLMIARPDAVSLNGRREVGALGAQKREQASVATNQKNVLPCDGLAYVIDDTKGEFEWPKITACLAETIPWRIETARLFGRDMSVPRMTAWFGDADYMYSGIHHRAAPFPAVVQRLRNGLKQFLAVRTMRFCSISIEMAATA